MNWLHKIARQDPVVQERGQDASQYFSIGHGDFDEEVGFEPKYVVWAYLDGRIEHGPEGYGDGVIQESEEDLPGGGTHGALWGHEVTTRTYKGRYEPETGRLSIVKPKEREFYDVPDIVMRALYDKFPNITKVVVF